MRSSVKLLLHLARPIQKYMHDQMEQHIFAVRLPPDFMEDMTDIQTGTTDSEPLPETAADMTPDPKQIATLVEGAHAISPFQLAKGTVVAEQVCYLPMSKTKGCPLLGKVSDGIWAITG